MKKLKDIIFVQKVNLCWEKWDPNDRTCEMNMKPDFIRFKGESKVTIISVSRLHQIGKNTTDIDWIAEIPKEFEISSLSNCK